MSLPALLTSCKDAWDQVDEGKPLTVLSDPEAAELKAVAAQIFPTTDTPGADEAGVIHFLDAAFQSFFARSLDPIRSSLQAINEHVAEARAPATSFAELSDQDQKSVMEMISEQPYFGLIKFLVSCGMFSHPDHGGNQNRVGWELLGFEYRHAWQPPFGYYDAEGQRAE